jgi:hypothetical protein
MKAIKSLVAAAALITTFAATAQTTLPTSEVRATRDDVFSEFVYDALGATPKIQFRFASKADAKAVSSEDKAAVAAAKAEKEKREAEANAARRASMISGY